jgi:hypothetical protein
VRKESIAELTSAGFSDVTAWPASGITTRTFHESDPLRLGIRLAPSIADSRSSECSLNRDILGRFNIIEIGAELAGLKIPGGGNHNEDLPRCRACAHGLVSDGATTFVANT